MRSTYDPLRQELHSPAASTPSNVLDRRTLALDAFDGHESLSLTRTALGKALLAFDNRKVSDGEVTRQLGYAVERNGVLNGCIAAPVGTVGEATTAISICGPLNKMSFDKRMTTPVRLTAAAILRSLDAGQFVTPTLQRKNIPRSLPTAPSALTEG